MISAEKFEMLKSGGILPAPHGSAIKIMELCDRENATLPQIIMVLQTDPALVGKILKIANSPSFRRNRPVAAISANVLMSIGIKSIRKMVLGFSLINSYRGGKCKKLDYDLFWAHSMLCGIALQLLGGILSIAPVSELFTVGLLSNVGQLALAELYPDRYAVLLENSAGMDDLAEMEKQAFEFSSHELASAMLQDWGLPDLFVRSVEHFMNPQASGEKPDSRIMRLMESLMIATRLSISSFWPDDARLEEFGKLADRASKLGVSGKDFVNLVDDMIGEWPQWASLMEIQARDIRPLAELIGS